MIGQFGPIIIREMNEEFSIFQDEAIQVLFNEVPKINNIIDATLRDQIG